MLIKKVFLILVFLLAVLVLNGETTADLDRGHQIILNKGFQMHALSWPSEVGLLHWNTFVASNYTGINLGWRERSVYDFNQSVKVYWSRWLNETANYISTNEQQFVNELFALQLGDEQSITDSAKLNRIKEWLPLARQAYPNTLCFTNQWPTQYSLAQLKYYMSYCQPDMLMFDYYPFGIKENVIGTNDSLYMEYMATYYTALQKWRQAALAGNDGTGTVPIPYGLYTQTFDWADYTGDPNTYRTPSYSEMWLNNFSALAFGYKYLIAFSYTAAVHYKPMWYANYLFDSMDDSSPNAYFYEQAKINGQIKKLGPALVRLLSTDVYVIPGQHINSKTQQTVTNSWPSTVPLWNSTKIQYIKNITASNNNPAVNNGLKGDIIVGCFKPLDESFDGEEFTNELYFMIVNGLKGNCTSEEAAQQITIDFDFMASGVTNLLKLNRETGLVEVVVLDHISGSNYRMNLTLNGGQGDLFKFNTGARFVHEALPDASNCFEIQQRGLRLKADLDGNCRVDLNDLRIFVSQWLNCSPVVCP